ncbi:MAG: hypothetical protein Q4D32_12105 [Eubacteriales bacterium]|nr:hypothetical protein [Eubacteriales bacterium]
MKQTQKNKILIITNHSYMLWRFRRELIAELMKENEVVLSMPFVGHEADFQNMGLHCIKTDVDRRGINPITDMKLIRTYKNRISMKCLLGKVEFVLNSNFSGIKVITFGRGIGVVPY